MIKNPSSQQGFSKEVLKRIAEIIAEVRTGQETIELLYPYYPEVRDMLGAVYLIGTKREWTEFRQTDAYESYISLIFRVLNKINESENGFDKIVEIIEKISDPKGYIGNPEIHKKIINDINAAIIYDGYKIINNKLIKIPMESDYMVVDDQIKKISKKTVEKIIEQFIRKYYDNNISRYLHPQQIVEYHGLEGCEETVYNLLKLLSDAYLGPVLDKKEGDRLYRGEPELLFRINNDFLRKFIHFNMNDLMRKIKEIAPKYGLSVINGYIICKEVEEELIIRREEGKFDYDVFICHASEDKEDFVKPLAHKLVQKGLRVWYDEFELTVGDSLRRSIEHGLLKSRFGIVVLSKNFFKKEWPQKELDALASREEKGQKVILPVWHGVDKEYIQRYSPMLADRVAVKSDKGIDYVVSEILRAIKKSNI